MTEFKPQTYRNAAGEERLVTSIDGAVNARADGFYAPDSPSGKRLASLKAAETRRTNSTTTTRKKATNGRRKRTTDTATGKQLDAAGEDTPPTGVTTTSADAATTQP